MADDNSDIADSDVPEWVIPDDVLNELVSRSRTEKRQARDELIVKCQPMVAEVVRVYVQQNHDCKAFSDDLVSSGHAGVTEAVDAVVAAQQPPTHVGRYIYKAIQAAVNDGAFQFRDNFGASKTTARQRQNKSQDLERKISTIRDRLKSERFSVDADIAIHRELEALEVELRSERLPAAESDSIEIDGEFIIRPDLLNVGCWNQEIPRNDTLDLIKSCCQDDRELQIVDKKAAGYSGAAIAKHLGVSRQTVSRILLGIEARYEAKLEAMNKERPTTTRPSPLTSRPMLPASPTEQKPATLPPGTRIDAEHDRPMPGPHAPLQVMTLKPA